MIAPARPQADVLVVEDDQAIRDVLRRSLRDSGFSVRVAGNWREAVGLYREHRCRIGVVLLDMGMEGREGPRTLAALRTLDPQVRCCLMSGHAVPLSREELLGPGTVRLLRRPFSFAELVQALWRMAQAGSG